MIRIVSFVKNPEILPVLDRLVNKEEGWRGERAPDLDTATTLVRRGDIDVVLLGSGTGATERAVLQKIIEETGCSTVLLDHYGGGSGLLYGEVLEALGKG